MYQLMWSLVGWCIPGNCSSKVCCKRNCFQAHNHEANFKVNRKKKTSKTKSSIWKKIHIYGVSWVEQKMTELVFYLPWSSYKSIYESLLHCHWSKSLLAMPPRHSQLQKSLLSMDKMRHLMLAVQHSLAFSANTKLCLNWLND